MKTSTITDQRYSISLCMIVKNESKYLESCLESARQIARQLIVVDTGSEDHTVEIAKRCGAEVYHHPWEGSFSKARNLSLEYASEEWILILDGDEVLDSQAHEHLKKYDLLDPEIEALSFQIINFTTDRALITEAGVIHQMRLFRNKTHHRYNGLVHNQLINLKEARPLRSIDVPVNVFHYGYTPSVWAAQNKDARIEMHERAVAEDPENHFVRFNYGNHLKILNRFEEALEQFTLAIPPMTQFKDLTPEQRETSAEMIWGTSACFLGAFCANKLKRYDLALCLVEEALSRRPHLIDAKLRGAEAYIGLKRYDDAIDLVISALTDKTPVVTKSKALHFDLPYRLGRALFLSGRREQAAPAFASLLPNLQDLTVTTHLCLSSIDLGLPMLWRYARSRGEAIDSNDPDWGVVDSAIRRAESAVKTTGHHLLPLRANVYLCMSEAEPLDRTLNLLDCWSAHLSEGINSLNQYRRDDELQPELTLATAKPDDQLYLSLSVSKDFGRLKVINANATRDSNSVVYCSPERYQPPEIAAPIESAALLMTQIALLTKDH